MGFVPCPNVCQLEAVYTQNGEIVENVFHVLFAAGITVPFMNLLMTDADTWDASNMAAKRHLDSQLVKWRARDLTTQAGAVVELDLATPRPGAVSGVALPNHATIAISWRTGLAGRSQRGRSYLVGLADSSLDTTAQQITPAAATSYAAGWTALLAAINANVTRSMVVLSRRHNGADRAVGVTTPITSAIFSDLYVDSQRRRLPKHNRHH